MLLKTRKITFAIVIICTFALLSFSNVSAQPAVDIPAVDNQMVTISITGLSPNENATILAVNKDVSLTDISMADVVFIDVVTSDANGTVSFKFDASPALQTETQTKYIDIYCGYETMDITAPISKSNILVYGTEPVEILYGDVNGDGYIGNADKTILARYLAGWTVAIDMAAADVNSDGSLGNADKTIISRHLAGWSGYDILPK